MKPSAACAPCDRAHPLTLGAPLILQMSFQIGRACPTCPRGMLATKDIEPGELILAVPLALAVKQKVLDHHGFPAVCPLRRLAHPSSFPLCTL